MSHIRPGDEKLHHEDGSHWHTGGDGTVKGIRVWKARMDAHMAAHKAGGDQSGRNTQVPKARPGSMPWLNQDDG